VRILRRAADTSLVLGSFMVAFLMIELILQFWNPFQYRVKGNRITLPVNMVYAGSFPADVPGLGRTFTHTKNSLGMRGAEPPSDLSSVLSIVTVGGSTTECFYLSDGKTWTDGVAARLGPVFRNLWVNNAGLDGHSSYGHLVLLEDYLVKLKPKIVLFLIGTNDRARREAAVPDLRNLDGGLSLTSPTTVAYWLANRSEAIGLGLALYRAWQARNFSVDHQFQDVEATRPRDVPTDAQVASLFAAHQDSLMGFRGRLDRIAAVAKAHGIEPVLMTQPSLARPKQGDPAPLFWREMEFYNTEIRLAAERHNILLIDLARLLPGDSRLYYDMVHFTIDGADAVARVTAEMLCPYMAARYPQHQSAACPVDSGK
jgi:lysophospholipase L1-like esterase